MDATTQKLIELVRQMRAAQKAYFAGRSPEALAVSKNAEAQVDRMLKLLKEGGQPSLFPRAPTPYDFF